MSTLRNIRWGVASISFFVITFFFLDFGSVLPKQFISIILALQVGPAFIKALNSSGLALLGLGVVIAATLLFGRVYCSHICPLGTMQDVFIWTTTRKYLHRRFPYSKPPYLLHYSITLIIITAAFAGSFLPLNLFEPFSNFGRILANLTRPLVILLNNAFVPVLTRQGIYFLYEIPLKGLALSVILTTLGFFVGLFGLTYFYGRFFCNSLCPVGGLLGFLSRRTLYRIRFDEECCIDCGVCERVCRARCLDSKERRIDFAACVGCFDCIGSCPTLGLTFTSDRRPSPAPSPVDPRRRDILIGAATGVLLYARAPLVESAQDNSFEKSRAVPVVAPGGRGIEQFSSRCTACHLCVTSCPAHVLQPAFLAFGFAGIMQPRMDYSVSFCTYDCTLCGEVCPTGALMPLTPVEKRVVQIGKTHFVKEDCIVETKKTDCGACSEHCPTKAVRMIPYGKLFLPEVDNQYCIGCGACEHACPTKPRKAIFVDANRLHGVARKRQEEKPQTAPPATQEFPF